ncbi:two pore domain potassium channel family protein [Mycobacterium sp. CBMA293]|uniref:potassium channel family protein n=1 Tax=unclassified Mycolicibacterium TaxID=2636767 RepID=UPI001327D18D|nr:MULTISPECIES: potassium channel family protein [unclassified Mycolicibacterium]MUL47751.1 two pore domain potassium channel family protein [Mycolicibacterium sp. CBMA 360]MUL92979.1 two pore domain potassium channel family protein [Mycolicibacterium sp. CBMA 230]MUL61731.1 two pore domain potassium channel family protein [Mycolicibacterium sp. CBMA 335]MUL70795.1 two pore domain potassium channel family protein [Mycolicibacterium sp. CBMA 311]MUM08579.1 ion transporter [Mycolicibacterium sp
MTTQDRLDSWEHRAEWPLAVVAALFLAAYSVDVLVQPRGMTALLVNLTTSLAWGAFTADYVVRLYLAPDRKRWFFRHLIDLAIVLLPLLRPLRLLRLVVLIGALQKAIGNAIRGMVIIYTVSGAVLLVYVGALAVYDAERGAPGAHITSFGLAVWWAITTITTVGYGDMYPVTTTGRVMAGLVMIGGISLVGSITATIASWIVQTVSDEDEKQDAATAAHIDGLRGEIAELRELLRANVADAAPAK